MNGAAHYIQAEQLLAVGTNMTGKTDEIQAVLATAQVHATLALAAAAMDSGDPTAEATWHEVLR